jgi:hypothetical protein
MIGAALALAGCGQAMSPTVTMEEGQPLIYRAADWSAIADHMAGSIQTKLEAEPAAQGQPIYISPPRQGQETNFGYGFRDLLTTHLVNRGINVTQHSDGMQTNCTGVTATCKPLLLNYSVQVVHQETAPEVLISAHLADGERILSSSSGIYYIQDLHAGHYSQGSRNFKVVNQ